MPVPTKPVDPTDGTPANDAPVTILPVALLTFELNFDIDAEEWFIDVAMDLARAADPFIRLSLVRYQPNNISGSLKVSTPLRVWTQLPPRRVLKLLYWEEYNGNIVLQGFVHGQASDGIKPFPPDARFLLDDPNTRSVWDRLQGPKMLLT
jgi:hypothetical protein